MKHAKRISCILLALILAATLCVPAFAEEASGSITISNATIDEAYHIFKLFDVSYGAAEEDGTIPTEYFATPAQKAALENIEGNVFAFAYQEDDGNYQVSVGKEETTGAKYTDDQVIAFINSFIRTLSGGVTACAFPGAVEIDGTGNAGIGEDKVATASTVTWNGVPFGYYFVTSSLGAVVSLNTANPNAQINDKNPDSPDWNNEPDEPEPDGPVKDVLDTTDRPIDGEQVKIDDVLTYSISYTNKAKEGDEASVLDSLVIKDAPPQGTVYVEDSAKALVNNAEITDGSVVIEVGADNTITWTLTNVQIGDTVDVRFQVTVTQDALTIETKTVENDADVTVKIGENSYEMKTNKVENPVEDPDDPVKDVFEQGGSVSINGQKVAVGDKLTYTIEYTNHEDVALDSVVVTDAAPTGTVYIKESARGERTGAADEGDAVTVDADGTITWTFKSVAADETVTARFDVTVTEAAQAITDKTIVNDADVSLDGAPAIKTNMVENPVDEEPDDPNPGKVIINADGSESTKSTGAYGDTVTFDIGINAVNLVEDHDKDAKGQAEAYYIYDQMDEGLTLKADSMKVVIAGVEYSVVQPVTKDNNVTTYNVQDGAGNVIGTLFTQTADGGKTLIEATIPWAEISVDADGNRTVTALYPNCKLHLIYEATINEDAVIAGDGNRNKVRFDYKLEGDTHEPDPDHPEYPDGSDLNHGSDEKVTVTYTYALALLKFSEETGEPLANAIFTAVDAGGNAIHAVETGTEGVYDYSAGGSVRSFKTNSEGKIIIKGVDIGTYTFTETEAPKGYNLLDESVDVTAQMDSATYANNTESWDVTRFFEAITEEEFTGYSGAVYQKNADGKFVEVTRPTTWSNDLYKLTGTTASGAAEPGSTTVTFPVNVAQPISVANNAGALLPSTGGIGTTIFYVLGGALVLAAAVLLVTKKRMGAER